MRDHLLIAKALSDENRLRALLALRGRELCVCQVMEMLQLAHSTMSKHMSILRNACLVLGRKRGRWMYYRLPHRGEVPDAALHALSWVLDGLSGDPVVREDALRLEEILKIDPEELCRLQREKGGAVGRSRS